MKALCKYLLLAVFSLGLAACGDDKDEEVIATIEVNYANLQGTWMLQTVNGEAPAEGTYCYIVFDRSEKTYKMYQNMGSMYAQLFTGSYELEQDEYEQMIISGTYDYTMGEAWNHDYYITQMLVTGSMTWTAVDDSHDVCVYTRCEAVPSEILAQVKEQVKE